MLTTIFTATYKGEHLLPALYNSLMRQSNKNFEWILVNDGSPDNTDEIVKEMQAKANFPFYYYKKETNGGKTTAINLGIRFAKGEMWMIVDHDDFLSDDAIEVINQYYPQIKDDPKLCAVTFLRHNYNGKPIGTQKNPDNIITDFCSYRAVLKIIGDRAEVVKTDYFKKICPMPTFENENNCSDGYIWLTLAKEYNALFIENKNPIYYCEYLPSGRSSNKVYKYKSPKGDMLYWNLFASMKQVNLWYKLDAYIHYWQPFFIEKSIKLDKTYKDLSNKWGIVAFPLAWIKISIKKMLNS